MVEYYCLFCPVVVAGVISAFVLATLGILLGIKRRWPSWAIGMLCASIAQLTFLIVTLPPMEGSFFAMATYFGLGIYSFIVCCATFALTTLVAFLIKKMGIYER